MSTEAVPLNQAAVVFVDDDLERAFHEKRGTHRVVSKHVVATAAFFFGLALFVTVASLSPQLVQVVAVWIPCVPMTMLALIAMGRPKLWVRLVHERLALVRKTLLVGFLLSVSAMGIVFWDEYRQNEEEYGDDPPLLSCEQQITRVTNVVVFLVLVHLYSLSEVATALDHAILCSFTAILLLVNTLLEDIDLANIFVVALTWLFVGTSHRSYRISQRRVRFTFLLMRRLERENITVKAVYQHNRRVDAHDTKPPWLIEPDSITLGRVLGTGGYGEVVAGTWRGSAVAVKTLHDASKREELMSEAGLLLELRHPNIVMFLALAVDDKRVMMVTELCDLGSVANLLEDPVASISFPMRQRISTLAQAAAGVLYLHTADPPVLHRDLKPANILIDQRGNAKISDFGISRVSDDGEAGAGTLIYMAPEVMQRQPYTTKSDVYSFALCIWHVCTGKIPFADVIAGLSLSSFPWTVQQGVRPDVREVPAELQELLTEAWDGSPDVRPPFATIHTRLGDMEQQVAPAESVITPSVAYFDTTVLLRSATIAAMVSGLQPVSIHTISRFAEAVETIRRESRSPTRLVSAGVDSFAIGTQDGMALARDLVRGTWAFAQTVAGVSLGDHDEPVILRALALARGPAVFSVTPDLETPGLCMAAAGADGEEVVRYELDRGSDGDGDGDGTPLEVVSAESPVIGIAPKDILIEQKRGRCGLGAVMDGLLRGSTPVTIKRIDGAKGGAGAVTLLEDVVAMQGVAHPHVVEVLGVVEIDAGLHLVTARVAWTLKEVIDQQRGTAAQRINVVRQAMLGLAHVHAVTGRAHGLLASEAVAVSDDLAVGQITDYGLQRTAGQWAHTHKTTTGSPVYCAPELFTGGGRPTIASDVFAMGVVIVEAESGAPMRRPWLEVVEERRRGLMPVLPGHMRAGPRGAAEAALQRDPESRPGLGRMADML